MNESAYKGLRDPINAPIIQLLREFVRRGQAAQKACDKIIEESKCTTKKQKRLRARSKK
jgi:hypothetical protein